MTFFDLFAGIGGFRLGMEQAGHRCLGFCEIDAFARKSYKAIHDTRGEVEMHDITAVSDEFVRSLRHPDVLVGGFPCQAFSHAGKRRGFADTRGTLFFEVARFASILRPSFLFLENVRGLLTHDHGATFETILRTLDGLGYDVEWQVLNSKAYVPQNRERIFLIGHSRGRCTQQVFPVEETVGSTHSVDLTRKEILSIGNTNPSEKGMGGKVFDSRALAPTLTTGGGIKIMIPKTESSIRVVGHIPGNYDQASRVYSHTGLAPTLCARSNELKVLIKEATQQDILTNKCVVRKLTPRECWRLQGFPEWAFEKAAAVNSDAQLYKQAGNSVTVPVIFDIARRLIEEGAEG